MNLSQPFIERPIATTLLMTALAFVGITAYPFLLDIRRSSFLRTLPEAFRGNDSAKITDVGHL